MPKWLDGEEVPRDFSTVEDSVHGSSRFSRIGVLDPSSGYYRLAETRSRRRTVLGVATAAAAATTTTTYLVACLPVALEGASGRLLVDKLHEFHLFGSTVVVLDVCCSGDVRDPRCKGRVGA